MEIRCKIVRNMVRLRISPFLEITRPRSRFSDGRFFIREQIEPFRLYFFAKFFSKEEGMSKNESTKVLGYAAVSGSLLKAIFLIFKTPGDRMRS